MNPIIRKLSLPIGILASIIQITITIYLYNFGSFVDLRFGLLIITINILFGITTAFLVKKNQKNSITLRQSFSGYFTTILVSIFLSSLFYLTFFNSYVSSLKKESIKKELFNFEVQNMKANNYSEKEIKKNIELIKSSNPFSIQTNIQTSIRYLILYSIIGIIFSFVFKNKSSFQEIPN